MEVLILEYVGGFVEFSNALSQNSPPSNPSNGFSNAQAIIALLSLLVQGFLTYMIYSVNDELKELESENHTPQFEVGRYRYYPRKEKDSFEVEISNFGQGSVRNLVGIAKALPDDSDKFDPKPVEIPLERTKAVESDWNAVRANGVAPNEHDVEFVCEASLKFGNLEEQDEDATENDEDEVPEEDKELKTLHFQQAMADLSRKGVENVRFKYWLEFDNEYCSEEETKHKVIDLIFPAQEDWTLERAINKGWDYKDYESDKSGYEMEML